MKNNIIKASLNTANVEGHSIKQLITVRVFDADYPILHNLSTAKTDISFSMSLQSNQQTCQNIWAHPRLVHWKQETIIRTASTHCFSIFWCCYILKWHIKTNVVFQKKDLASLKMIMMLRAFYPRHQFSLMTCLVKVLLRITQNLRSNLFIQIVEFIVSAEYEVTSSIREVD